MSKILSKNIEGFNYLRKVLTAASVGVSIASFATVICPPDGVTSARLSLVFPVSNEDAEKLLRTMRKNKKNRNKIVLIPQSKLNSIEK